MKKIFTGMYDVNGIPIHIGDVLFCYIGKYRVIVQQDKDGGYSGKLVCSPSNTCADIPFSIEGEHAVCHKHVKHYVIGKGADKEGTFWMRPEHVVGSYRFKWMAWLRASWYVIMADTFRSARIETADHVPELHLYGEEKA